MAPSGEKKTGRIAVTLNVELSHSNPTEFLNTTVAAWLREHAEPTGDRKDVPYRIISATIATNPDRMDTVAVGDSGEKEAVAARPDAAAPRPGFANPQNAGGGNRPPAGGGAPDRPARSGP